MEFVTLFNVLEHIFLKKNFQTKGKDVHVFVVTFWNDFNQSREDAEKGHNRTNSHSVQAKSPALTWMLDLIRTW